MNVLSTSASSSVRGCFLGFAPGTCGNTETQAIASLALRWRYGNSTAGRDGEILFKGRDSTEGARADKMRRKIVDAKPGTAIILYVMKRSYLGRSSAYAQSL